MRGNPDPDMTSSLVKSLVEYFRNEGQGEVDLYTELAQRLSKIAHKEPIWSWRYVKSVESKSVAPSGKFALAIEALGAALDEVPAILVYSEPVTVVARPGAILPNSFVMGHSKRCKRKRCRVVFVPNVPWREYCSIECAALSRNEK